MDGSFSRVRNCGVHCMWGHVHSNHKEPSCPILLSLDAWASPLGLGPRAPISSENPPRAFILAMTTFLSHGYNNPRTHHSIEKSWFSSFSKGIFLFFKHSLFVFPVWPNLILRRAMESKLISSLAKSGRLGDVFTPLSHLRPWDHASSLLSSTVYLPVDKKQL